MTRVQLEDCKNVIAMPFIDWESFRGTKVVITGSTGLIGSNLVKTLACADEEFQLGLKLVLPVRSVERAEKLFAEENRSNNDIRIINMDLSVPFSYDTDVDYIVHMASPTSSKYFINNPVETLCENFNGMRNMLEFARRCPLKKFLYTSTMEVYGHPQKGTEVTEKDIYGFDPTVARNSYPLGKIASEALCFAYQKEYQVPGVSLRLTQTFGPGVQYDDGRVFAEFMRCAMEKKDIVLKTPGLTERQYLYTADAVSAILIALQKGEPGEAYSVSNPETYCSIAEMAGIVASDLAEGEINVSYDIAESAAALGYADTLYMKLNIQKILDLGWKPTVSLPEAYRRMIRFAQETHS